MNARVRLFAVARLIAGRDRIEIDLSEGATVADLRRALAERVPELAGILGQVTFAVGTTYADDTTPLSPNADVACIPPVSGG